MELSSKIEGVEKKVLRMQLDEIRKTVIEFVDAIYSLNDADEKQWKEIADIHSWITTINKELKSYFQGHSDNMAHLINKSSAADAKINLLSCELQVIKESIELIRGHLVI